MDPQIDALVEKLLIKYDKDNNDVLDKMEIVTFLSDEYARSGKSRATISEAEEFIKAYDSNKDGVLSKE